MSINDYRELISQSHGSFKPTGFTGDFDLPSDLFPHQRACVEFSLRAGASAMFLDTGLGKTYSALAWGNEIVKRTNKPVLMLAPLGVTGQHALEAEKYSINAKVSRDGTINKSAITITNYDKLHLFDETAFSGIILDECFAPDTLIDVVSHSGKRYRKHIKDIRAGEFIENAAGVDVVSDVHRREVKYAIEVTVSGRKITSSPNHPFFTERGWVGAQDLIPGDKVVATSEAVRILRNSIYSKNSSKRENKVLREILLSEMADETAGAYRQSPYARNSSTARRKQKQMVQERFGSCTCPNSTNCGYKTYVASGSASESIIPIESHGAQTFRAWGQWQGDDIGAIILEGCSIRKLGSGVSFITGKTNSWLSNTLQDRLSARRKTNSYRGGWCISPFQKRDRRKKDSKTGFFRVDGIEVLELGNSKLDKYRDADGKLYFYDLGGTQHPSFSINGALVHNSSILKSFSGATTKKLISSFNRTPYRLACTATPAPNDHTELGTHSEFLGTLNRDQMLMRWFLHDSADTGTWRLKGHAVTPFWNWVASWSRCISKPSDLGFSDIGFDMPDLILHKHLVQSDRSVDRGFDDDQSLLFRMPDTSATSIHREKKLTKSDRAQRVVDIVMAEPNEPWTIWVETDYDADAIMAILPDAVEVRGSMSPEEKEEKLSAFTSGKINRLVTKARIAGFGLNWQHCARTVFAGMSFSYEAFYQAVRRHWRFRQQRDVHCHVVFADTEAAIWDIIQRKAGDHDTMKNDMREAMARAHKSEVQLHTYNPSTISQLPEWA